MPRSLHMSYVPARKGWMKFYKGKMYSVSCRQLGCAPCKEGSWLQANVWWEAKQAEIDAAGKAAKGTPHPRSEMIVAALEAHLATKFETSDEATQAVGEMVLAAAQSDEHLPDWFAEAVLGKQRMDAIREGMAGLLGTPAPSHRTVKAQVEEWLTLLRASVAQKLIDEGRYDAYSRHVRLFQNWLGAEQDVATVTAAKLEQWWAFLSLEIAEGRYSPSYAKTIFMTAKQWTSRLAEVGLIPMPGNIRSRRFKFNGGPKRVERLTVEEVQKLLAACDGFSDRTKLYLLLMLNCGMYQSDISDLGQDEVDWDTGTLTRPRSKTPRGPEVTYRLWPETFALLRQFRATTAVPNERGGNRAVLTERGTPLVLYWMEGGKMRRYDVVQSAFLRLFDAAGLPRKPIKLLRKTSASELGAHPEFSQYVQYFLAHSPKGVADRHYILPDNAAFFRSLDWLRGRYLAE